MANKKLVDEMLADLESARKSGRAVSPPSRLQRGNILGAKTAAFNEAVKQQGKVMPKPKPYKQSEELFEMAERAKKVRSR